MYSGGFSRGMKCSSNWKIAVIVACISVIIYRSFKRNMDIYIEHSKHYLQATMIARNMQMILRTILAIHVVRISWTILWPVLFSCASALMQPVWLTILLKVCRQRQKTFLFLFSFFFLLFFLSFLFFSTAEFLQRCLRYFSTNLYEIRHVYSPWWDEEPEYNFKSIGPGIGTRRGPKVLLCSIIGKTLYTKRRDNNFT